MSCNQHRHIGDNYTPKYPKVEKWFKRGFFLFTAGIILAIMIQASDEPKPFISEAGAIEEIKAVTLEDEIKNLKLKTVRKLAAECETKGSKHPNSEIVFDTNAVASVGRFQYQLKTVQYFVKTLYKKDISRDEALLIAMGQGSIDVEELTKRILFEVKGGENEWFNCNKKLGLTKEIELIKSLGK